MHTGMHACMYCNSVITGQSNSFLKDVFLCEIKYIFTASVFFYPGTCEIINVTINTTSLPGSWQADCNFISCAQSVGCLVFLNETFCTASKRYQNNSSSLSCLNNVISGPGVYTIMAYAVLSNGSYRDCVYTGVTVLTNKGIQDFIKINK